MSVEIEKRSLPDQPGHIGYQITGDTKKAVQTEISKIMNDPNVLSSEFGTPFRTGDGTYRSRGYVVPKIRAVG